MNKQKALELFEAWWDDYDMRAAFQAARINRKWPDVIVDEGDDDWQLGLYVGWMNAMKARADLAAERERELIHALQMIHSYAIGDDAHDMDPEDLLERIRIEAYRQIAKHKAEK